MNIVPYAARAAYPYARYVVRSLARRYGSKAAGYASKAASAYSAAKYVAGKAKKVGKSVRKIIRPTGVRGTRASKALPSTKWNAKYKLDRMTGKYGGSFGKPKKLTRLINKFQTKGFESTTEVIGTVADPDCVYVGASAVSTMTAIECAAQALLRALFEKCVGIPITNIRTPLQGYYNTAFPFNNADGFRLQLTWMQVNLTSGEREVTYETGTTDSIYTLVGQQSAGVSPTWVALMQKLRQWAQRSSPADANTEIPLRLNLYRRDGNVSNFYVGSGGIDLRDVRVHYATSVAMKLQNRSLSAAGSSNTDTVDANPLQGYLYEFRGGVPMFRNLDQASGTLRLNRMFDPQAVITARAATMTGSGAVNKEPPKPRFFANCVKSVKVKLEPGEVKKHFFTWKTSARLLDFLRKMNQETDNGIIVQTVNTPGKCCLFALEDMINVNATNNIAVTYEVNRVDKCYITVSPYTVAQGIFTSLELNDLP